MDEYAKWIGYAVMVLAALGFVGLCIGLVCDYVWRHLQAVHGLKEIMDAMQNRKTAATTAAKENGNEN